MFEGYFPPEEDDVRKGNRPSAVENASIKEVRS